MSGLLTRKKFENWLRKQDIRSIVGWSTSTCACPIGKFLQSQGGRCVHVRRGNYRYDLFDDQGERVYKMPQWANDFVKNIDEGGDNDRHIMQCEAIAVLESV